MFFKVEICLGFCGMDTVDYFEDDCLEAAEITARQIAIDWAESYGFEQNIEVFGDYDMIGRNFDEDTQEYEEEGCLDYAVVEVSEEEYKDNTL